MAKLLFRLAGVGEDEAQEVRQLLHEAGFEFYETEAGRWQISLAAIWLKNDSDFPQARSLLNDYQQKRQQRILASNPSSPPFWQHVRTQPMDFVFVLLAIAVILGLMLWPFIGMIR